MSSRAFSSQVASVPHITSGHGLGAAVRDLRTDVEAGFSAAEAQTEAALPAQANIRLNTQPTAGNTITIGSDIYEFVASLGAQAGGHIGVLRGASAAAALANIISAINGAPGAVASASGTNNLVASIYNTDFLHIEPASSPGGPSVTGPGPNLALSNTLTAGVSWDHTNLNKTGWGGTSKRSVIKVVVDATNLAADFDVKLPFTPYLATCFLVTNAAGVPDATGKAASILTVLQQARQAVTIDLNGGATDPVATDVCYFDIRGV